MHKKISFQASEFRKRKEFDLFLIFFVEGPSPKKIPSRKTGLLHFSLPCLF
jgi:hypothetical protein